MAYPEYGITKDLLGINWLANRPIPPPVKEDTPIFSLGKIWSWYWLLLQHTILLNSLVLFLSTGKQPWQTSGWHYLSAYLHGHPFSEHLRVFVVSALFFGFFLTWQQVHPFILIRHPGGHMQLGRQNPLDLHAQLSHVSVF